MGVRHEMLMAEAEEVLRESNLGLPVARMVDFVLNSAETSTMDNQKLQDLAAEIRAYLDHNRILRKFSNKNQINTLLKNE